MRRETGIGPGQAALLMALLATGFVILMVTMAGLVWSSASWDVGWMNPGDHMSRMMGGGGTDSSADPLKNGGPSEAIVIQDFMYDPGNLVVPVGATIRWTNRDTAPHSATATDGSWDTGLLSRGDSAEVTLAQPGAFEYFCTVHPNMKARLLVE